jgi:chromosome segregation protein
LAEERRELEEQEVALKTEVARLEVQVGQERSALTALREQLREHEVELAEISERRQAMEAAEAAVESEQQAFREKKARLQAGQEAARAEASELARRIEEAELKHAAIAAAMAEATEQERQTLGESESASERWRVASSELEDERGHLAAVQAEHEEARGGHAATAERLQAITARIEALAPLTTGEEGLNPAVQAALAHAERLDIRGILGREIDVSEAFADGVEAYLGAYMEGLLVDDQSAVEKIRHWFLHEYDGPGGLVVLPLSRVEQGGETELPDGLRVSGIGAPWLRRLLRGVKLGGGGPDSDAAWVGQRESVDVLGIVRIGRPYAGGGLLARKAELDRLQGRRGELESELQHLAALVTDSQSRLSALASQVGKLESARRSAAEEAARLAARAEASSEKLSAVNEQLTTVSSNVAKLQAERSEVLERGTAEAEALRTLRPAGTEAAPRPEDLAQIRSEWETARERVTRLQLDEAKASGAFDRVERELQAQQNLILAAADRAARVEQESGQLKTGLAQAEENSETAARDLESLFEEQSRLEVRTREVEERVEDVRQKVSDLETTLRKVQHEERSHSDRRHELQLERTQIDADLHRTRERLEDEWGRPFLQLASETEPAEGEHDELREELSEVAERLGGIGLVNMLAEQEFQEERERLEFLEGQREDLAKARDDLRDTIRQINETASTAFLKTFEQARANFKRTFQTLFEGGECDVWLEDPTDPLDSPVEISASPRGKRTQRIHLLSGGERALTALSLLFAIYLVKPSPFCVMDEVDAPLDETNILRFVSMLEEFKADVQFIVITHNPVTIEAADWIYGVTMEEPGVSKIVGVEFSDYARGAVA